MPAFRDTWQALSSIALLAVSLGCGAVDPSAAPLETDSSAVARVSGIAYAADRSDAHRLDLYLPKRRVGAALIVFVHGGGFMSGDRRDYGAIGRALADEGMAVVIPSYRGYPLVDAQGSTQDVAAAIAWTHAHARAYGLDPVRLFLVGHSAGAQIVAMIGTHRRYLEAAGGSLETIRGIFSMAGAYDVRDLSGEPDSWLRLDYQIFGETAEERAKISPALSVDPQTPFTEAVCGTEDDPGSCPRTMHFVRALEAAGVRGRAFVAIGADHMGLLRRFIDPSDPLHAEFRYFLTRQTKEAA